MLKLESQKDWLNKNRKIMIETISSLALIGSGAYLLAKGYAKEDGGNDGGSDNTNIETEQTDYNQSSIDRLISKQNSTDKNDSVVENNTADAVITGEDGKKVTLTKDSSMYLGNKNEDYDMFYDYSPNVEDVYFDETSLNNTQGLKSSMAMAMRCRILSPFFAEGEEYDYLTANKSSDGRYKYWTYVGPEYKTCVEKNISNNELSKVRDAFRGTTRLYSFVLEVFNPFKTTAPLRKVVFNNIKIGSQICHILNVGGYCHEADDAQMMMNKKFYTFAENGDASCQITPYEFKCKIDIKPRQSVFLKIVLNLGVLKSLTRLKTTTAYHGPNWNQKPLNIANYFYMIYLGPSYYDPSYGVVMKTTTKELYEQDPLPTYQYWYLNQMEAPESVYKKDFHCDATLVTGSEENYTYNHNTGNVYTKSSSRVMSLSLKHDYRKEYKSKDDWKQSYMGDHSPSSPDETTGVITALDKNISIVLKGEKLLDDSGNEPYDFTHENLG